MGAGLRESQAQIVFYIPAGEISIYNALPNDDIIFKSDGFGVARLLGSGNHIYGSMSFEGVVGDLTGGASASTEQVSYKLPNVNTIRLKWGELFMYDPSQISENASIYLHSSNINMHNGVYGSSNRSGDIILVSGQNMIYVNNSAMYWGDWYDHTEFVANSLIRESLQATVLTNEGVFDNVPNELYTNLVFKNAPDSVNGIMPYSVTLSGFEDPSIPHRYYFSTAVLQGGRWKIKPLYGSNTGQQGWNSNSLNIWLGVAQSLTANRAINSLQIRGPYNLSLQGHILSIFSGGILSGGGPGGWRRISNGTITTAQDRYFFHIYSDPFSQYGDSYLAVSASISGTGKELVKSGPGLLRFEGSQPNTYTGNTYVHQGTLELMKSPKATAVRNVIVDKGSTLQLSGNEQIDDSATVTLIRHSILSFNGASGIGLTEKIHTLQVDGRGVINFAGGTLAQPNVLETTRVLLPTADDTLFIRNWIEYADYFLVSRAFAPNTDALSRIWFEGWAEGAKLRDYNAGYWEIVPFAAPEPSTYGALLGIVGVGLYLIRRRRKTVLS